MERDVDNLFNLVEKEDISIFLVRSKILSEVAS